MFDKITIFRHKNEIRCINQSSAPVSMNEPISKERSISLCQVKHDGETEKAKRSGNFRKHYHWEMFSSQLICPLGMFGSKIWASVNFHKIFLRFCLI